jgi:molybdate transport system ATP-binding protein
VSLEAAVGLTLGQLDLDVELEVASGELVVLLGPNGAGKTTLLRALAGLLPLERGRVVLDGTVLEDPAQRVRMPTEQRPVGLVFQDYLLFPNMSTLDNVAFGLQARGIAKAEARARARGWLHRVGLDDAEKARPRALSGGQAQRVALARTLATDPGLLLLDEPLAALDAATRVQLRRELRRHLASFDGVRLLVTHDHLEAVALADRLVVIEHGRITQTGKPDEISARPRSRYVAELVGVNLYRGRSADGHITTDAGAVLIAAGDVPGGRVFAAVHPRAVALHRQAPARGRHGASPRNVWAGAVDAVEAAGGDRVRVRVIGELPIVAEVTTAAVVELRLAEGGRIWAAAKATEVDVYPD